MKKLVRPAIVAGIVMGTSLMLGAAPTPLTTMPVATTGEIPLTDLETDTYLGFTGGLYLRGSNDMPADHLQEGLSRANAVQPLDTEGAPDEDGKYVLLSIGMSNATEEFCSPGTGELPCTEWSFMGQAADDGAVDDTHLVIANGAQGGKTIPFWDSPFDPDYNRVRDTVLAPQGLSEAQVQVIWLKNVFAQPTTSLPSTEADAYDALAGLGRIVRAAHARYPNLQQVFLSDRTYGGYATTNLHPEPYAYEAGFAVKWLIEAQIRQIRTGRIVRPRAGDLDYDTVAPWIAWGPYLWADGINPRSDGLVWLRSDFAPSDGTHPSQSGEEKVGSLLMDFFTTSPVTKCWFLDGGTCP